MVSGEVRGVKRLEPEFSRTLLEAISQLPQKCLSQHPESLGVTRREREHRVANVSPFESIALT